MTPGPGQQHVRWSGAMRTSGAVQCRFAAGNPGAAQRGPFFRL